MLVLTLCSEGVKRCLAVMPVAGFFSVGCCVQNVGGWNAEGFDCGAAFIAGG